VEAVHSLKLVGWLLSNVSFMDVLGVIIAVSEKMYRVKPCGEDGSLDTSCIVGHALSCILGHALSRVVSRVVE
jgi:hypothetical protein